MMAATAAAPIVAGAGGGVPAHELGMGKTRMELAEEDEAPDPLYDLLGYYFTFF